MDLSEFYKRASSIEETRALDWIQENLGKLNIDEKITWIDENMLGGKDKITSLVQGLSETYFKDCKIKRVGLCIEYYLFQIYHHQLISKDNPGKASKISGVGPFIITD